MVFNKILELQKAVRALQKNASAYNYDYTNGDKILSVVRPKMDELSLLLLPEVKETTTERVEYKTWNKALKAYEDKVEYLYRVRIRFTWVDAEDGTSYPQDWEGYGMNAFDKGFGSALTYGERYYLLKMLHIATDKDDVDAISTRRDAELDQRPDAPKAYAPCNDERYATYISKAAADEYITSKAGVTKSAKAWWIIETHPDDEALAKFDRDVELWQTGSHAEIFNQ